MTSAVDPHSLLRMRIRILQNFVKNIRMKSLLDQDPGGKLNADPDPQPCENYVELAIDRNPICRTRCSCVRAVLRAAPTAD